MRWLKRKNDQSQVSLEPTSAKYAALLEVFLAITKSALISTDDIKKMVEEHSGVQLSNGLHYQVTLEFFNFYANILDRLALQELGVPTRNALLDMIRDFGIDPLVRSKFEGSSEDWHNDAVAKALVNFNDAQAEYGPCEILIHEDSSQRLLDTNLDNPESVFSRLYCNVSDQIDFNHPQLYLALVKTFTEQVAKMQLKDKVIQAGKFLP